MTALPRSMTDIAAELRRQLDESEGGRVIERKHRELADERNAHLARQVDEVNRQVEDIRNVLIHTADDVIRERGPSFWSKAFQESRMQNAKLKLDLEKRNTWLRESGEEAARLQTERDIQRGERDSLRSQLDSTQERCDQLERELDRRDQRIAALEAQVARLSETITSREVD